MARSLLVLALAWAVTGEPITDKSDVQSLVQLHAKPASAKDSKDGGQVKADGSIKVVSSWSGVRRNLTFIHIPRSGGTAVEDVRTRAKDAPVPNWGVQDELNQKGLAQVSGTTTKCFLQHHPPNLNAKAFAGSDTFCVVRDPVSRMISQFGFEVSMFSKHNCSVASLNEYFRRALSDAATNPYSHDCHLMPQSAYVYGWNSSASPPQLVQSSSRFCKNVLRFEHIEDDFNNLMENYNYPLLLERKKTRGVSTPSACARFGRQDFDPDVLEAADRMYKDDYALLKKIDAEYVARAAKVVM